MKRLIIGKMIVPAFVIAVVSAAALTVEADENVVRELESQYETAVAHQDVEALDQILADDFVAISSRGEVRTKKLEIDDIRPSPDYKLESFKIDESKLRIFGSVIVVTGRSTLQASFRGNSSKSVFRYTRVYAKRGQKWQVVSQQLTRVPQQ
jgi:ketosteroid isomerase-like protein